MPRTTSPASDASDPFGEFAVADRPAAAEDADGQSDGPSSPPNDGFATPRHQITKRRRLSLGSLSQGRRKRLQRMGVDLPGNLGQSDEPEPEPVAANDATHRFSVTPPRGLRPADAGHSAKRKRMLTTPSPHQTPSACPQRSAPRKQLPVTPPPRGLRSDPVGTAKRRRIPHDPSPPQQPPLACPQRSASKKRPRTPSDAGVTASAVIGDGYFESEAGTPAPAVSGYGSRAALDGGFVTLDADDEVDAICFDGLPTPRRSVRVVRAPDSTPRRCRPSAARAVDEEEEALRKQWVEDFNRYIAAVDAVPL
eukprot:TRINITY_DN14949_c0_g1_i1.p1 TRINITY_DN14949_c0_g1~~TRINITY_DN14949_c0_g1_i1.p1  ORF type:complete len:326 (+),score=72.72 TRINITY_DN14949_c0_g1_i1:53-979(+)